MRFCFGHLLAALNILCVIQYDWRHGRGPFSIHYDDVIMGAMTSQITSLTIVCLLNRLFRRRSKKTSKLRVTGLCAGNSPGTGEFPAQMASNAEMFPFHDVIMSLTQVRGGDGLGQWRKRFLSLSKPVITWPNPNNKVYLISKHPISVINIYHNYKFKSMLTKNIYISESCLKLFTTHDSYSRIL